MLAFLRNSHTTLLTDRKMRLLAVAWVYSLVKRGRLKPMPGSGRLLFTREALDASLQKRRR
jgi:hypothetical protein